MPFYEYYGLKFEQPSMINHLYTFCTLWTNMVKTSMIRLMRQNMINKARVADETCSKPKQNKTACPYMLDFHHFDTAFSRRSKRRTPQETFTASKPTLKSHNFAAIGSTLSCTLALQGSVEPWKNYCLILGYRGDAYHNPQ